MHQIKFVKRPPEYTVALGGSGDIIDLGHFDTKVAESASASSQDNNGGKKPRIIIIGSPSGSAEDELDEDKPSERPSGPRVPRTHLQPSILRRSSVLLQSVRDQNQSVARRLWRMK